MSWEFCNIVAFWNNMWLLIIPDLSWSYSSIYILLTIVSHLFLALTLYIRSLISFLKNCVLQKTIELYWQRCKTVLTEIWIERIMSWKSFSKKSSNILCGLFHIIWISFSAVYNVCSTKLCSKIEEWSLSLDCKN